MTKQNLNIKADGKKNPQYLLVYTHFIVLCHDIILVHGLAAREPLFPLLQYYEENKSFFLLFFF